MDALVRDELVNPIEVKTMGLYRWGVELSVILLGTRDLLTMTSYLERFLNLRRNYNDDMYRFDLLIVVYFFDRYFVGVLRNVIVIAFLVMRMYCACDYVNDQIGLVRMLEYLRMGFTFITLRRFRSIRYLLRRDKIDLTYFRLEAVSVLREFAVDCAALGRRNRRIVLSDLRIDLLDFLNFDDGYIVYVLKDVGVVLRRLINVVVVDLCLLRKDVRRVIRRHAFKAALFDVGEFFRPVVDHVGIQDEDRLGVVRDFNARNVDRAQRTLRSLAGRFEGMLRSRVVCVRRLVGVLLMVDEVSVLGLARRARWGLLDVYGYMVPRYEAVLRCDRAEDMYVLGIADSRYFVESAAIQVAVFDLYRDTNRSAQGRRSDRGHLGFRYVWVLIIVFFICSVSVGPLCT